ncbi:MAG: putative pseudouridine synthase, partial [Sphingomonas bacterium]|nr:putative pseudouridine synthase [Sphingomonas bacterium]
MQRSHKIIHNRHLREQRTGPHGRPMPLADRILFIDAEALVLDKPAGLPVDAPRHGGDSIAGRLHELKYGFRRPPTA